MNPANRTLAFVLVAACSVGIAVGAHRMYQPSSVSARTDVGTAFYPDFEDSTAATYLGVAAFNPETSRVDEFRVERRDGRWVIPSHHNYPADAKDRLARTAASMIGITRGQLVDTTAASHERLNLIDPLTKDATGTEGRGSRITLKAGDTVLTDLIIGKKEDVPGADRYYVRRADEDRVYLTEIRPNLTTKFTDWIQPNVLDVTASTFRQIDIQRYTVEFNGPRGVLQEGVSSELSRDSSTDEWKLKDLPEGMKLKTSVVNQIVSALADIKIVGVRAKTSGIAAAFRGDAKVPVTSVDIYDMQDKGYFQLPNGELRSKEGDFFASTSEGITYALRFGSIVSGDDVDIEIGDSKQLTEEEAKKALEAGADSKSESAEKAAAENSQDDSPKKENRFLFVTAMLDERSLGTAPVEPVKPTPPPGYTPKEKPATPAQPAIPGFNTETPGADSEPKKETSATPVDGAGRSLAGPGADPVQEEKQAVAPAADQQPQEATQADAKPADSKPTDEQPAVAAPDTAPADPAPPAVNPEDPAAPVGDAKDPVAEYETALAKYEQELDEYRVRKAEYDERLSKARDRVKALNERFAPWYYVIPADVFNTINVKPEELVEPDATTSTAAPPGLSLPAELTLPAEGASTSPPPAAAPDAAPGDAPLPPAASGEAAPPAATPPAADASPKADAPADPAPADTSATEPATPPPSDSAPQPE